MKTLLALCLPLTLLLGACGAPSNDNFVAQAEEAGEFEIGSSRLAKNKSENEAIKQFADKMIADHTAAGEKLRAVAQAQGIGGDKANALSKAHQTDMEKLEK